MALYSFKWKTLQTGQHYRLDSVEHVLPPNSDRRKRHFRVLRDSVSADLKYVVASIKASAQFPWWLSGGSLLGYHRHQGFIPWDDDVDIHALASERDISRLAQTLKKENVFVYKYICPRCLFYKAVRGKRFFVYPSVDIFLFDEPVRGKGLLRSDGLNGFTYETDMPYLKAELFPLNYVSFENLIGVPVPRNSEALLTAQYGDKWRSSYAPQMGHLLRGIRDQIFSRYTRIKILPMFE